MCIFVGNSYYSFPPAIPSSVPEPLRANTKFLSLYETMGVEGVDENGDSLLHLAAAENCGLWVRFLLEKGADPCKTNAEGNTVLHCAVCSNDYALVSLLADSLCAHGGDVNIRNNDKYTPLHLAVSYNAMESVKALLYKGADIEGGGKETGLTPLWLAICNEKPEMILFLINAGASVFIEANRSFYLHQAAVVGSAEVVRALLSKNAPAETNSEEASPVVVAVRLGNWEILRLICEKYPHLVDTVFETGRTLLHEACENDQLLCVKVLLELNPSLVVIQDAEGQTPLHIAASDSSKAPILQALVDAMPEPRMLDIFDMTAMTPLKIATVNRSCQLVQILLKAGADMYKVFDEDDPSPILEAIRENDPYLFYVFLEADPALYHNNKIILESIGTVADAVYRSGSDLLLPYVQHTVDTLYKIALFELSMISGLNRKQFLDLEGKSFKYHRPEPFYSCMAEALPEGFSMVRKALLEARVASTNIDPVFDSYSRGELIVVTAGWKRHAICIVMQNNILIFCNRGKLSKGVAFRAIQINPKKVTKNILKEITKTIKDSLEEASGDLFKDLPLFLTKGVVEDPAVKRFCDSLPSIGNKMQKWDNCSCASVKAAVRASIALTLFTSDPELFEPTVLNYAKELSKEVTTRARLAAEVKFAEVIQYLPDNADSIRNEILASIAKRGVRELKAANREFTQYLTERPLTLDPITSEEEGTAAPATDFDTATILPFEKFA